jgi:FkbM family methyltransferase
MTVVDVGANIGLFGLFCAQACAAPRIFAFEPNPAVRARLEANLAAYAPGARTFACAVGAAPGHARFTVFSGYSLLSGLHPDAATETELVKSYVLNQGRAGAQGADDFARDAEAVLRERFVEQQIDVDIRTLADVIASEHIEHIDLLKIDVEKAEVDVLAGLGPDDWAKIDQIVAEIDLAANVAPIERMLEAHGFDYVIDQDEMLVETELRHVYAIRRGSGLQLDRTADDRAPREVHPVPPRFLSEAALAAWCRTRLPDDAVPEAFVLLEALPRTANGAVDRAALPEPAAWRHAAATETEVERWLSATLRELLDVATLGRDEDFLAASGDSLLGQLAVRIEDTYGVALPRRALFMAPTVRSLGAAIELELRRAEQLLAELDGMSPDELAALLAEGEA